MGEHTTAASTSQRSSRGAVTWWMAGGLAVLAGGALLDIGHHAGMPGLTAEVIGAAGHLVTLAGMALTAAAVALAALQRRG